MKDNKNTLKFSFNLPSKDGRSTTNVVFENEFICKLLRTALIEKKGNISFLVKDKRFDFKVKDFIIMVKKAYRLFLEDRCPIPNSISEYVDYLFDYNSAILNTSISGRKEELDKMITLISSENKCNCILAGEEGVGKTSLALEFSRLVLYGNVSKKLKDYTVIKINTSNYLSNHHTKFSEKNFYKNLEKFLYNKKKKIILYIDNMEDLIYMPELINIFRSSIINQNLKIIGSVNLNDLPLVVEKDYELLRYLNIIYIEEFDINELQKMLTEKVKFLSVKHNMKITSKILKFAIMTSYYLSSDFIKNPELTLDILKFAITDAKIKNQKNINKHNIMRYYDIDYKLSKKTSKHEKTITAYHEAGHYLVARLSKNLKSSKNAFVSILPIGDALGLTAQYYETGTQLTFNKEYYLDEIAYCFGGRVGEYMYTNEFSSGASSDLEAASSLAESIVLSGGLSSRENSSNKSYTYGNYVKDYLLTEETKNEINLEISELLNEGFERAKNIISDNKKLLEIIVKHLIKDGIMIGEELDKIVTNYLNSK